MFDRLVLNQRRKQQSCCENAKEEEIAAAAVGRPCSGHAALLYGLQEGSADETEASRLVSFLWESGHLVRHPPLSASPAMNYWPQMFLLSRSEAKKQTKTKTPELILSALLVPCQR